ncbi:MAG: hypothetical protein HY360_06570 [Verrucomicrobia bacterium]|nr:hypothetical protein [Verrucomicrobiota bacterium]
MKLGLVLECDSGGPDELVLTCLARRLASGITVQAVALGSKEQVFLKGPETAAELVESSRCDLVLIVWDLKPYWQPVTGRSCQAETEELRSKLAVLPNATSAKIRLLCLTWEIETWLIADARAVNAHLSTSAHKAKFKCASPLSMNDAKAFLDRECKKQRGPARRYVDVREAIQIAQLIPDTHKARRIPSFKRFANLACGNPLANFQQCGDVCNDLVYQAQRLGRE